MGRLSQSGKGPVVKVALPLSVSQSVYIPRDCQWWDNRGLSQRRYHPTCRPHRHNDDGKKKRGFR